MRPLRLTLQAFGSFPGANEVDFDALRRRGLFVVTGPTGTGKSTIFDAMCFALYGALPGGRATDGEPRSHHAPPHLPTFVRFEFESEGQRYCVEREPRQERPKARGAGTTVAEPKATLAEVRPDGSTVPVATGTTNVTRECERLVGLEARHFQRVVLLPQGRFTDFLVASDETREQLLRQLFGGELYERATALLKRRVDGLRGQVGEVREAQRHHRRTALDALALVDVAWGEAEHSGMVPHGGAADPADDALDAMLVMAVAAFEPVCRSRREHLEVVQRDAVAAAEALSAAEQSARRFLEAGRIRAALAQADVESAAIEALATAVVASQQARPVVEADRACAAARQRLAEAEAARDQLEFVIVEGFGTLGVPVPPLDAASVAAALAAEQQRHDALRADFAAAEHADGEATEAEHLLRQLGEQVEQEQLVQAEVQRQVEAAELAVTRLEPDASAMPQRRSELDGATDRLERRRRLDAARVELEHHQVVAAEAERHFLSTMRRFIDAAAARLAAGLLPGDPCPVCGSPEHPHPAPPGGDAEVDLVAVDVARAAWDDAATARATRATTVSELSASLGDDADAPLEVVAAAERHALVAYEAAQQAVVDLEQARQRMEDLRQRCAEAETLVVQLRRDHSQQQVRAEIARRTAQQLAEQLATVDRKRLGVEQDVVSRLLQQVATADRVFGAVATARVLADEAAQGLATELADRQIADVPAAQMALLDTEVEAAHRRRVEQWRQSRRDHEVRLAQLHEQGVPDTSPDVDALRAVASSAREIAAADLTGFTTASDALDRARTACTELAAVGEGAVELLAQQAVAEVVFRTCNGEAGRRVKLERWVLGVELERVTEAANEHLVRMTHHRYRLRRATGQRTSLGLEVFDAHTGRARSTTTLSGGEQFQASLALALGLADVVSQGGTGSGRRFEALFVDEGFGSLDPAALDDAIDALQQLHATGRMVGAITHVDAMKQSLPIGIQVVPLPDGRGSRLEVLP